jgi:hypothetical protein
MPKTWAIIALMWLDFLSVYPYQFARAVGDKQFPKCAVNYPTDHPSQ